MVARNVLAYKVTNRGEATRQDLTSTPNVIYFGFAKPGSAESDPVWSLMKATLDISGNIIKTEFPNGSDRYVYMWTGRVGYAYL